MAGSVACNATIAAAASAAFAAWLDAASRCRRPIRARRSSTPICRIPSPHLPAGHLVLPSRSDTVVGRDAPGDVGGAREPARLLGMYWLLLFLAVVAVWLLVLALLAKKLWGKSKALLRELGAAQSKLDAAMSEDRVRA
ncbi:hypothetical protein GCM10009745_42450 [Kribbella yunnanensis]|uniref:Uncharacterized protein n=2 Tax=Kribbellaceae TaxID=2726069 RepID=A0ABN2HS33_9ACTN